VTNTWVIFLVSALGMAVSWSSQKLWLVGAGCKALPAIFGGVTLW